MDLTAPVRLKGVARDFGEYCDTVRGEQRAALEWLASEPAAWEVPAALRAKVDDYGRLLPLQGDTIAAPLAAADVARLRALQETLRAHLPGDLAEPLDPAAFHVTLHDLASGTDATPAAMERNRTRCRAILAALRDALSRRPDLAEVTVRSTVVYPSCGISLVLGLVPRDEAGFRALMNAYHPFDEVVYVEHWPRLHVTLDYFLPRPLDPRRLRQVLDAVNPPQLAIRLDLRRLAYQRFRDMNHYETVLPIPRPRRTPPPAPAARRASARPRSGRRSPSAPSA